MWQHPRPLLVCRCGHLLTLLPASHPPPVPLGGLVGDNIHLVPERVVRLASRLRKWVALRRTPPQVRRPRRSTAACAGATPRTCFPVLCCSLKPYSCSPTHLTPLLPQDRKLAILLYGFPPGVGATGTAALLNVPKSLERLLGTLRQVGARQRRRQSRWARHAYRSAPLPRPNSLGKLHCTATIPPCRRGTTWATWASTWSGRGRPS